MNFYTDVDYSTMDKELQICFYNESNMSIGIPTYYAKHYLYGKGKINNKYYLGINNYRFLIEIICDKFKNDNNIKIKCNIMCNNSNINGKICECEFPSSPENKTGWKLGLLVIELEEDILYS